MAEKSDRYLAPFGGITRIRFKGFVQDVSAVSAPPLCWRYAKGGRRKAKVESTMEDGDEATELPGQVRSQTEFENEDRARLERYPLFSILYPRWRDPRVRV